MSDRSTSWSAADDAELMAKTNHRNLSVAEWQTIAAGMSTSRTWQACRQRRNNLRLKAKGIVRARKPRARKPNGRINHRVEMQQPCSLPEYTSLTAAFFKDPVPGRSALDKIRAGLA